MAVGKNLVVFVKFCAYRNYQAPTSSLVQYRAFKCTSWKLSKENGLFESPSARLSRSFQLLGLEQDKCGQEEIKKAYIRLVKKYHPDSSSGKANAERFSEVDLILHVIHMT